MSKIVVSALIAILIMPLEVLGISSPGFPGRYTPPAPTVPIPKPIQPKQLNQNDSSGIANSGNYYSSKDFYYTEKDGRYITLNLFSKKIVIQLKSSEFLSSEEGKKFLSDMDWSSDVKIEKMELPVGTSEAKRSFAPPADVYVVSFPNSVDVLLMIDKLAARQEVTFVSPVFWKDHDLVFPAGIWLKTKRISPYQESSLISKLASNGFTPAFADPGKQIGSAHLNYYRLSSFSKENLNVLAFSRLLAQDVLVEWAIPDFVSTHPLIIVSYRLSRPSGTINDPFKVTFTIYYDKNRVIIDAESLKSQDPMVMKPSGVMNGLFRPEKPVVRESNESSDIAVFEEPIVREFKRVIAFENTFRVYQTGEFFLLPLSFAYTFLGAPAGTPSEKISTPNIFFKISELVPKDQQGNPLIRDIFDWRKMPYFSVSLPPKPAPVLYPKSDYRYYVKNISRNYPMLSSRLKQIAFSFFAIGILGLAFLAARRLVIVTKRRRERPYLIFRREASHLKDMIVIGSAVEKDKIQLITAASAAMRDMFGFDPGKTKNEMLASISELSKPEIEKFFSLIQEFQTVDIGYLTTLSKIDALMKLLKNLKKIAKREKS